MDSSAPTAAPEGGLASAPVTSGPSRARALADRYQRWEAAYEAAGGDSARVLNLRHSEAFSSEPTAAWGQVKLDLVAGRVTAGVVGADGPLDLWVVSSVPGEGRTSRPSPGDRMEWVGSLTANGSVARLDAALPTDQPIDLAVVTRAGVRPDEGALLVAYSTLFHRLHDRSKDTQLAVYAPRAPESGLAYAFGPPAAEAAASSLYTPSLEDLIAEGEFLFTKETFDGNGRTCASCHPPLNNFTIDQDSIARLPAYDPLFVAEFNPALADLENPELMREHALIRENQDGFDQVGAPPTKFNMRSVPHTLAMTTSVTAFFVDSGEEFEVVGWSGDGSTNGATPSADALRDFANGAIQQHFPQTMAREEGYDFRFATIDELDAMEAFQLSLGRQEDIDLASLTFKNPDVTAGSAVFNARACAFCHQNAGANDIGQHPFGGPLAGANINLNTGVENFPLDETLGARPHDGGFGRVFDQVTPLNPFFDADQNGVVDFPTNPIHNCSTEPTGSGGFGDGAFNIPTLIEAADTPPFFHNNAVETLEEAVAFYGTSFFNCSPGGRAVGGIAFEPGEVEDLAAFLRALNVLENIRASDTFLDDAITQYQLRDAQPKIRAALADMQDGIEVLHEGNIYTLDASREIQRAMYYVKTASKTSNQSMRNALLKKAKYNLHLARGYIVVE
ncbi:MAG: hypothetical protein Q8P41_14435 [Pseudomonadota bacterium]|nr:hypothetical protein [Pseudomonadota bacterium]